MLVEETSALYAGLFIADTIAARLAHQPPPKRTLSNSDVANCTELALKNKIGPLFLSGCDSQTLERFGATLGEEKTRTVKNNSQILHSLHDLDTLLEKAGIRRLFYKGPLQQHVVYGNFFEKPSMDGDLLVVKDDFDRTGKLLTTSGFELTSECNSAWWRVWLGEQHFFRTGRRVQSIDLHHRLQQPGCAPPRDLVRFFTNAQHVAVGDRLLTVPSKIHVALIISMNLVKGIYGRHSSANHAVDLFALLQSLDEKERDDLINEASHQGLLQTLLVASQLSALMFNQRDVLAQVKGRRLECTRDRAVIILCCPDASFAKPPRRRFMMALLCDRPLTDFPIISLVWMVSETARLLSEGKAAKPKTEAMVL